MKRLLWVLLAVAVLCALVPLTSAADDSFGRLTVRAVDQDGIPVPDLRIRVIEASSEWETVARARTGIDGAATLHVAPGSYKVAFAGLDWNDPYLEEWWDDASGFEDAEVLAVTASSEILLDPQLQLGGFISGRIVDADTGAPLTAQPMLWADDLTWGKSTGDWRSDSNGYYRISGIPTGTFHVSVDQRYDGYVEMWHDGRLVKESADPVHVTAGQDTTGINFSMVVGGTIKGTIYSEATRTPLSDMTVKALNQSTDRSYEFGLTNDDGQYSIGGLPAGAYKVRIEPWDGVHLPEWIHNADSQDDATPIMVKMGETTAGIDAYVSSNHFHDDESSVFHSDIEWLANTGITKGCNPPINDKYCPDSNVTRGQMAAFLVRALNLTDRSIGDVFTDDDDSVFEADIEKLATAGITKGCNPPANDKFCPDAKVRREVMAAFLVRALHYTDDGGGDLFIDDDGSIFEADIDKLATAGVTRGCNPPDNDKFCPTRNVTRGQMAAFLHRALGD